jgi:hypothetical protein
MDKIEWEHCVGFRGERYIVFRGNWQTRIHYDLLSRNLPYKVEVDSRQESGHKTLDAAKARVLQLLEATEPKMREVVNAVCYVLRA